MIHRKLTALIGLVATGAAWSCDLQVSAAWIREAPGNATALAGYALLGNVGNKTVSIATISSAAFAQIAAHESVVENGVAKMRSIDPLQIPAGGKVEFAPTGKHFMLMNPKSELHGGDMVAVKFKDSNGCETTAQFKVSKAAVAASDAIDHSKMDHSKMDHGQMDHSAMHPQSQ